MRPGDIADLLKALAGDVREFVAHALAPVQEKQAALEQRLDAFKPAEAAPGPAGPSAYELAVAGGYAGSESEWLASLHGQDGKSVAPADIEPLVAQHVERAVATIPAPKDGQSVTVDDIRPMVEELVDKAAAAIPVPADGQSVTLDDVRPLVREAIAALPVPQNGRDGKDGQNVPLEVVSALVEGQVARAVGALPPPRDGNDGRDAAAIEPLPAIDVTRSYAKGTWATHQGGLWLARSATDGMAGWSCIVNGVAQLDVVAQGVRGALVKAVLSDGRVRESSFAFPAIVYCGAWTARSYEPGDTVSWEGSMWHCESASTDRPGTSPAWKLCVKHGRDGKDGRPGTKGDRGIEGRPGRDLTQLGFDGRRT